MAKTGAIAKLTAMAKERQYAGGGIAKLAQSGAMDKLAKLLKGTQKTLPAAERKANLDKMLEGSAVKDRLYHGTGDDITEFRPSRIGAMGPGTYLTKRPEVASGYSDVTTRRGSANQPNVLPVYAQIKKPFNISNVNKSSEEFFKHFDPSGKLTDDEVIELVKKAGYDAIHALEDGEINVLDPRKIKSAIGNRGTYDTNKPELNEAKGGEVRMKKGGEPVDPRFRTAGGDPLDQFVPPRYRSAGRRPESQQDREASANIPVAVARGLVSGTLGLPADLLNLPGAIYSGVTGKESYELPFGSEYIEKRLPFRGASQTPVGELFTGAGQLAGGAYTGPLSGARAAMAVPRAAVRAGRDFVQAAGQPAVNVIKPPGGNWLSGSVERAMEPLKRYDLPDLFPELGSPPPNSVANKALNQWIDRNLANYVKKQMATPDDPVRKLAEEGVVHIPSEQVGINRYRAPEVRRHYGTEQLGKSEAARAWEDSSDVAFSGIKIKDLPDDFREPWMANADPNTMVYSPIQRNRTGLGEGLGFDHIVDVLKQDLDAGRIRPEQLNKVSMEQAVRRTAEFDQEMAKRMREAQIKATEGMPVYKEYPEGYRWIELKAPEVTEDILSKLTPSERGYYDRYLQSGDSPMEALRGAAGDQNPAYKALESALKYEGETMGHCVGGYCPDVAQGRSRIYSLRDAKGEPHVTVEVEPRSLDTKDWFFEQPNEIVDEIRSMVGNSPTPAQMADVIKSHPKYIEDSAKVSPAIVQIKGKQNRAPNEQYLPFVQDFVRSGQWSGVGDFKNTGLYRKGDFIDEFTPEQLDAVGKGEYLTMDEIKTLREGKTWKPIDTDPDLDINLNDLGMKAGGEVKMAAGGIAKLKALLRAPAKSKEEIEEVARRVSPQVTGEFVRGSKGTASVAEKTQKQFAREKDLPVEFTDVKKVAPKKIISPQELKGTVVTGIPGDPTVTGKSLVKVGETKLELPSPQHGGPLYGMGRNDDIFWASGIGPAGGVQRVAKEASQAYDAPVVGQYIMMGPDSINYAQHFADANLQAIDLSKMSKSQIEEFNKLIRFGDDKSGPRPGFPGIEDKIDSYLHFSMDPHLRRHFNKLMQMPTVTEKFNLPSGQDIRYAITEAPLRNMETGVTGYSMGELAPDVTKSMLPLSAHPTYSHDIPGRFIGGLKYPTPYEMTFPDTLMSVRANPKQAGQEFGSLKMVGPRQIYDQQMIDELMMYEEAMKKYTGKKKGGKVGPLSAVEKV